MNNRIDVKVEHKYKYVNGTGKIKFTISEAGEFIEMKTPFGYDLKSKVIMKGNKIQP